MSFDHKGFDWMQDKFIQSVEKKEEKKTTYE